MDEDGITFSHFNALGSQCLVDLLRRDAVAGREHLNLLVPADIDENSAANEGWHVLNANPLGAERIDDVLVLEAVIDQELAVGLLLADVVQLVDMRARVVADLQPKILCGEAVLGHSENSIMPLLPFSSVY